MKEIPGDEGPEDNGRHVVFPHVRMFLAASLRPRRNGRCRFWLRAMLSAQESHRGLFKWESVEPQKGSLGIAGSLSGGEFQTSLFDVINFP